MKDRIEHRNAARWQVSRRDFLKASGVGVVSALWLSSRGAQAAVKLRFGLVTDLHYADIDAGGFGGNRYYRESLAKLRECVGVMNGQNLKFLCETGDFKDQDTPPNEATTLGYLKAIDGELRKFNGPRHYVFGNHDLDSLSKAQHMSVTGAKAPYYSFDESGVHFVVLDACFDSEDKDYDHGNFNWQDTNVSKAELEWLAADLSKAAGPTIAFVHQRLDGEGTGAFVKNAAAVRKVLEASGKVLAVFQGHDHAGAHNEIAGIHYYTLKGLVEGSGEENNTYAVAEVRSNGDIAVTGYRKAVSIELKS